MFEIIQYYHKEVIHNEKFKELISDVIRWSSVSLWR